MDITAREVLEEALMNYPGSVIIVSHDRFFISQVVNTIFSFDRVESETGEVVLHEVEEEEEIDDLELYKRTKHMSLWDMDFGGGKDEEVEVEEKEANSEEVEDEKGEEDVVAEEENGLRGTVYDNSNAYEINRYDCDYYQYLEFMAKRQLGMEEDEYEDEEYADEEYENDEGEESGSDDSVFMDMSQIETIKDRMTARYIEADTKYRIAPAKKLTAPIEEKTTRKKNFGGSGVTSGDKFKGIKNAKRFHGNA